MTVTTLEAPAATAAPTARRPDGPHPLPRRRRRPPGDRLVRRRLRRPPPGRAHRDARRPHRPRRARLRRGAGDAGRRVPRHRPHRAPAGRGLVRHPPPGDGRHRRPRRPGGRTRGRPSTGRRPTTSTAATPTIVDPFGHRWLLSEAAARLRTDPWPPRRRRATCRSWSPTSTGPRPSTERSSGGRMSPPTGPTPAGSSDSVPRMTLYGGQRPRRPRPAWQVDDVAAAVETVRDLGGTATDPVEMPYGHRSDCTDDQGMAFTCGSRRRARPPPPARPTSPTWPSTWSTRPASGASSASSSGWTFTPGPGRGRVERRGHDAHGRPRRRRRPAVGGAHVPGGRRRGRRRPGAGRGRHRHRGRDACPTASRPTAPTTRGRPSTWASCSAAAASVSAVGTSPWD